MNRFNYADNVSEKDIRRFESFVKTINPDVIDIQPKQVTNPIIQVVMNDKNRAIINDATFLYDLPNYTTIRNVYRNKNGKHDGVVIASKKTNRSGIKMKAESFFTVRKRRPATSWAGIIGHIKVLAEILRLYDYYEGQYNIVKYAYIDTL